MKRFLKLENPQWMDEALYDVTENQKVMWLANQMDIEAGIYNEPVSIQLKGNLNLIRLQKALEYIVVKHVALQMNIVPTNDGLKQIRKEKVHVDLDFYDWSSYPSSIRKQKLDDSLRSNLHTRFDLTSDKLFRFQLYQLGPNEYLLYMLFHHIIFDGWSLGLLLCDLELAYSLDTTVETEKNTHEIWMFENLLHKHLNYIGTVKYLESGEYWRTKLEGTLSRSAFPTSKAKSLIKTYQGGALRYPIRPALSNLIEQFSKVNQVSSYRVWLSIYIVLLNQMTNQTDLLIGMPINTRSRDEEDLEVFGYFVNTVPLRIAFSPTDTFLEVVQKVSYSVKEAIEHRNYPLNHITQQFINQNENNPSLYSTVFNMIKLPNLRMEDLETGVITHHNRVSIFDMVWRLVQSQSDTITIEVDYNAGMYEENDIQNFIERFEHLLKILLENSDISMCNLNLLLPQDYDVYQNTVVVKNVPPLTLDQLIDEQADIYPDCIAITMGQQNITYQELRVLSNKVALTLLNQGFQKQNRVSIILNRSIEAVVSMIGVLKAGGTYVPVDPDFPEDRIRFMLQDSESTHIITSQKFSLHNFHQYQKVILYEDMSKQTFLEQVKRTHATEDGAYIIYTSGSTGSPKGVLIPHKGVIHLIKSIKDKYHFQKDQVHIQFASLIFDASVWEIYSSLLTGGRLHILSEIERKSCKHFIEAIEKQQVNFCLLPTVFFHTLSQAPIYELDRLNSLNYVFVGGESLLPETVRKWQEKVGLKIPIVNAYGPTESTVCVATYPIINKVNETQANIPIGKPLSHTEIYILNEQNQICPPYVPGEIYIGGDGLAQQYVNQPVKTKEAFVTVNLPTSSNARLYKSGDQGRITQDGQVEFLGRKDKQVKIRGYRIELEEIEEQMLQHPSIEHATVIVYQNKSSDQQLMAFYILQKGDNVNADDLQAYLSEKLPYFMLPSYMQDIEKFPLTPSGKIDSDSLQKQAESVLENRTHRYTPPHTDTELQLQNIWAEVLRMESEQISIDDDFFTIGGHSLLTVQVINRIHARFHVQISLKDLYIYRTIHTCAEYIDQFNQIDSEDVIQLIPDQTHYPLSHAQKRLWFLYKRYPEDRTYDIPIQVQIQPGIQIHILNKALCEIVKRHEIFRTVFREKQGEPGQHIQEELNVKAIHVNITNIKKGKQAGYRLKCIQQIDSKGFDLEKGPLFRSILFTENEDCSWLYLNFHHIVMDEWSLQLFLKELFEIYDELLLNKIVYHTKPVVRYVEYVAWQSKHLSLGTWELEEQYWKQEFQNSHHPQLSLPYDRLSSNPLNRGAVLSKKIDQIHLTGLKKIAQQEDVSLFILLFTAYTQFLQQICGQNDLVIGTPVSGRQHTAFEDVQGFFVNTVAIRINTTGASTMQELCEIVKEKCFLAFQHQNYPFDKVIEVVNPERKEHDNPIFQTMFSYQQNSSQLFSLHRLDIQPVKQTISKFNLSLTFVESEDGLIMDLEYNTDLFERTTISRFAEQLWQIIQMIQTDFTTSFGQLSMLSDTDKAIYQKLNDTCMALPPYSSIQERFYQQVYRTPKTIAISTEDSSYTYEEVNHYSNQIAHYLIEKGMQPNDVTAIFLDRSFESIVCMLGVLKAGCTYVPIDIKYPSDRVSYIFNDSKAKLILTKEALKKKIQTYNEQVFLIEDIFASSSIKDILSKNRVDDTAYMIYTSGSTGNPKGTLLRHAGVLNLVEWRSKTFCITEQDVLSQFYSHSFDSSVSEIFSALLTGARLHLLNEEQRISSQAYFDAVATYNITISDVATAFFKQLANEVSFKHRSPLQSLRVLIMGGEAASAEAIRNWHSEMSDTVQIVNEYGPTETTVSSLYHVVSTKVESTVTHIPIGKPIANTKVYILNENMQLCPIGVIGELYIESIGTAIGYVNQPEITKLSFLSNPFSANNHSILYKTGDLARLSLNGNVEYMGRRDRQVKIRGYRIELGEIEDVLMQEPRIQQSVVLPDAEGKELHAYYTVHKQTEISIEEVYKHVSTTLPEYMVPKGYVCIPEIPVTQNGKIDAQKLIGKYQIQYQKNKNHQAPVTETQKILANVWAEVLNKKDINIKDDFFSLGGHSLKIMPTLVKLKPYFPKLRIQDFFQYPTIEKMAKKIEKDAIQLQNNIVATVEMHKNENNTNLDKHENNKNWDNLIQVTQQKPRCVLLTGGTGFLGAHILEQLLLLPDTLIYCLVRNQKQESLEIKVQEKMKFYFGESILEKMKHRVKVIEGDLSQESLGLTPNIKKELIQEIDTIIHCGGEVRHYGDREHFIRVNVKSTQFLIDMSKEARARFHYISTISISGHAPHDNEKILFYERDFDKGQQLDNVYVESKFLAEKLVRKAIKEGVSATVYRVGNLVGHTLDGRFQENIEENAFYRLIKAILLLQMAPDIRTCIDLVPIDFGSKAIVQLVCTMETEGETFHIINPVQLEWKQFIEYVIQMGHPIKIVNTEQFMNLFKDNTLSEKQKYALELIVPLLEETAKNSLSIPTCKDTQRFLQEVGVLCELPNAKFVSNLIDYGYRIGFFSISTEYTKI
ncbi:non-ribosomal peptide synthetase [Lysinibacillus sphaericus]|uniref:Gramicidin synthetase n=5 Tax=Lysinibacillus TaxID=400634 RepID=W7S363_LYSSH|nr:MULTISPECIES: non-ribosomal peptide synthetase [Lysinibacillus]AMO33324.1 non-ribosomal peptide synthetase [Lysinibacillus sphaericus]AMR91573.1 non-ribosomal peptide synthetase [Lysinibacillus sphaericus]ANA45620.1 non-ribosomal peptide synthetase [Lysinibacillus sphaericus]EWH32666.1 gramicidin synthetase [Lysinibacillus sphaericus CBAM5]KZL45083.1 non-ribosomal peptide synthetase [Lysinibacillus sphaericus]